MVTSQNKPYARPSSGLKSTNKKPLRLLKPNKPRRQGKAKVNKTSTCPKARLRSQRSKKTWKQSVTSSSPTAPPSPPDCYKAPISSRCTLSTSIASRHALNNLKSFLYLKRSDFVLTLSSKYTGVGGDFVFNQFGALRPTAFLYHIQTLNHGVPRGFISQLVVQLGKQDVQMLKQFLLADNG